MRKKKNKFMCEDCKCNTIDLRIIEPPIWQIFDRHIKIWIYCAKCGRLLISGSN